MAGDTTYRNFVGALWALVGAVRDRDGGHVEAAASLAHSAFLAARGDDSYVMLHEQDGAIHVNGRRLALGIDVFAAAHGLASLLHGRGIGEVLFDASVDGAALVAWARCWVSGSAPPPDPEAELASAGVNGVHASPRHGDEPPVGLRRRTMRSDAPDSRLRSVFLLHHLVASIPADGLLPPTPAKVVVEAVAERLLGLDGGLEPLLLLQRDEGLLRRSLHVAVLAAAVARVAGCDEERLADLGGAALLHDVGAMVDATRPATAGFQWLLERGSDEFWLRCAIVARTWRDDHGASVDQLDPGASVAPAFVRLAVELEQAWIEKMALPDLAARLRSKAAAGAFPREFVEAGLVACSASA